VIRRTACLLLLAGAAGAQPLPEPPGAPAEVMGDRPTTRPPDSQPTSPTPNPPGANRPLPEAATRADAPLEEGRSSFTEAQARSRIEQAGFTSVSELRLQENGIWRATAEREGRRLRLGLDFRGTVRAD